MNPEHCALPFVHPVSGEHMTSYHHLTKYPLTSKIWMTAFGKELGGMCQGKDKTGMIGNATMFVMDAKEVPGIPKYRPPTYTKVGFASRLQKDDPD